MTNIKYETEIIRVLHAAGQEGLSVQKISLHVRNACSSLFEPLDMEEVHRYVQAWLGRNVKGCCPMVLRTARRGVSVINLESRKVRQLELEFLDTDEPQTIGDECADNVSDEELQLTFL